jgi:hypothetical protein
MGPEWRQTLLTFVSVIVEFVLGAVVFFGIIFVAHWLKRAIGPLDSPDDAFLHATVHYGEIVLLVADCLIGLYVCGEGLKNAWKILISR